MIINAFGPIVGLNPLNLRTGMIFEPQFNH